MRGGSRQNGQVVGSGVVCVGTGEVRHACLSCLLGEWGMAGVGHVCVCVVGAAQKVAGLPACHCQNVKHHHHNSRETGGEGLGEGQVGAGGGRVFFLSCRQCLGWGCGGGGGSGGGRKVQVVEVLDGKVVGVFVKCMSSPSMLSCLKFFLSVISRRSVLQREGRPACLGQEGRERRV